MARLIIGLGNPGDDYVRTRHNVGFWLVDHIVDRDGLSLNGRWKSEVARWTGAGDDTYLIKPQTYMNLSGEVLARARRDIDFDPEDILVVHDDVDLLPGELKFKLGGGEAGHNGLKSISQALGVRDYVRLRIGVGPRPRGDLAQFVLKPFPQQELDVIFPLLPRGASAVETWLREDVATAMNRFNGTQADKKTTEE